MDLIQRIKTKVLQMQYTFLKDEQTALEKVLFKNV